MSCLEISNQKTGRRRDPDQYSSPGEVYFAKRTGSGTGKYPFVLLCCLNRRCTLMAGNTISLVLVSTSFSMHQVTAGGMGREK